MTYVFYHGYLTFNSWSTKIGTFKSLPPDQTSSSESRVAKLPSLHTNLFFCRLEAASPIEAVSKICQLKFEPELKRRETICKNPLHYFLFTFKIIHAKFMSMQQKLSCWPQSNAMDRLMPISASSTLQKKTRKVIYQG